MGTLRSKLLVVTPGGTIARQSGNVPKHYHLGSNEIQYVNSGSGTFWLGNEQHQIHPGDLNIVPKGTAHAGSVAISGEFKALAIKLPPQAPGDTGRTPFIVFLSYLLKDATYRLSLIFSRLPRVLISAR